MYSKIEQLYEASDAGDTESVTTLLSINEIPKASVRHAITLACEKGHLETLKLLAADPRASDFSYGSQLFWAAIRNYQPIVKFILETQELEDKDLDNGLSALKEYGRLANTTSIISHRFFKNVSPFFAAKTQTDPYYPLPKEIIDEVIDTYKNLVLK